MFLLAELLDSVTIVPDCEEQPFVSDDGLQDAFDSLNMENDKAHQSQAADMTSPSHERNRSFSSTFFHEHLSHAQVSDDSVTSKDPSNQEPFDFLLDSEDDDSRFFSIKSWKDAAGLKKYLDEAVKSKCYQHNQITRYGVSASVIACFMSKFSHSDDLNDETADHSSLTELNFCTFYARASHVDLLDFELNLSRHLDLAGLVARCDGDSELALEVLDNFFRQGLDRCDSLMRAARIGADVRDVRRSLIFDAEFLWGSALNVGAWRVVHAAEGMIAKLVSQCCTADSQGEKTVADKDTPSHHFWTGEEIVEELGFAFFTAKCLWDARSLEVQGGRAYAAEINGHSVTRIGRTSASDDCGYLHASLSFLRRYLSIHPVMEQGPVIYTSAIFECESSTEVNLGDSEPKDSTSLTTPAGSTIWQSDWDWELTANSLCASARAEPPEVQETTTRSSANALDSMAGCANALDSLAACLAPPADFTEHKAVDHSQLTRTFFDLARSRLAVLVRMYQCNDPAGICVEAAKLGVEAAEAGARGIREAAAAVETGFPKRLEGLRALEIQIDAAEAIWTSCGLVV
mmetsp:Transcript_12782/g.35422  ORF Transcript_12782/g.35422 Transcript_12782/m.35422 type:complete len:574 (+) Transcript_12782:167-1888(+)